jgi:hypothetical protein
MVLIYKRLEGGKFAWPTIRDGMILSRAQFEALTGHGRFARDDDERKNEIVTCLNGATHAEFHGAAVQTFVRE